VFNRVCYDQGSRRVDWTRPYITQVQAACVGMHVITTLSPIFQTYEDHAHMT
jgi:hypothetical protein